ncbi:Uncharacterised protein [Shewanella putrefaciens]|nr:Uncharacterised protein [Shewanella putrefaciens]
MRGKTVDYVTVYPRAYGEQNNYNHGLLNQDGLSPCLRGTGDYKGGYYLIWRFIPVLTGNSREEAGSKRI